MAISKISNETIPIQVTPTNLSSGITIARNACYRIGRLVVINLSFTSSSALSKFARICKFPRPACNIIASDNDSIVRLYAGGTPFELTYEGRLIVDDAMGASTVNISGCYITRD